MRVTCASERRRLADVISNLMTGAQSTERALRQRIRELEVQVAILEADAAEELPETPPTTRDASVRIAPKPAPVVEVECECEADEPDAII